MWAGEAYWKAPARNDKRALECFAKAVETSTMPYLALRRVFDVADNDARLRLEFLGRVIPADSAKRTQRHVPLLVARAELLAQNSDVRKADLVKLKPTCSRDAEDARKLNAAPPDQAAVIAAQISVLFELISSPTNKNQKDHTGELEKEYKTGLREMEQLLLLDETYRWNKAADWARQIEKGLRQAGEIERADAVASTVEKNKTKK